MLGAHVPKLQLRRPQPPKPHTLRLLQPHLLHLPAAASPGGRLKTILRARKIGGGSRGGGDPRSPPPSGARTGLPPPEPGLRGRRSPRGRGPAAQLPLSRLLLRPSKNDAKSNTSASIGSVKGRRRPAAARINRPPCFVLRRAGPLPHPPLVLRVGIPRRLAHSPVCRRAQRSPLCARLRQNQKSQCSQWHKFQSNDGRTHQDHTGHP